MRAAPRTPYDPRRARLLTFHDAVARFGAGTDTPVKYLERCLAVIAAREPVLKAFTNANLAEAMRAAEASAKRYAKRAPASPVDGMPLAIKDIFETRDLPTGWGVARHGPDPGWRDAAVVASLRRGGAALVGKTALPELGFGRPPATTNPWDPARSPGGSSSGSAAAVGAAMVPAAIGTQGKGSLTRPASFCGAYAFKPSHGAIHRGGDGGGQETNTHVGVIAGSLTDAWIVARYLSEDAGPHPGHVGIEGPMAPPEAAGPRRLVRFDAAGWSKTDAAARRAYGTLLDAIAGAGIAVVDADDAPATRALAGELAGAAEALDVIADYESRWPLIMYLERARDEGEATYAEQTVTRGLARAGVTRAAYHEALRYRAHFQNLLAACREDGLFFAAPAATGPAPADLTETGSSVYQWASSLAGNPVVTLPFMEVGGMPFGLQLEGFSGADAALVAAARALDEAFAKGEI